MQMEVFDIYILQCKKLNSKIGEVRDAAKGQITFLRIVLKNMQDPQAYPNHDSERRLAT